MESKLKAKNAPIVHNSGIGKIDHAKSIRFDLTSFFFSIPMGIDSGAVWVTTIKWWLVRLICKAEGIMSILIGYYSCNISEVFCPKIDSILATRFCYFLKAINFVLWNSHRIIFLIWLLELKSPAPLLVYTFVLLQLWAVLIYLDCMALACTSPNVLVGGLM